jgi:zinc D-Ala-D-Ala carboxypeptidase
MNLSPHFTLEEMTRSEYAARRQLNNDPGEAVIKNLARLCKTLEEVRSLVGRAIVVQSGYRSPEVNRGIGGSRNSQHISGCAADIRAVGLSATDLMIEIADSKIAYDQLILEFNSWVHISVPSVPSSKPRMQRLIIDRNGTRGYS